MKIIVDGFGGDNAPAEVLKGCAMAVAEYGVEILLAGKKEVLEQSAQKNQVSLQKIEILDAPEILTMEDSPKDILRTKKNSSMSMGIAALRDGRGDAFVSAGNTGALVLGSNHFLKCIPGIKRAALAPILPSDTGCFMLLDAGANLECTPEMLFHFGIMGSLYMEKTMRVQIPRVGLVNIGAEETKGGDLQRQAFALLKASKLHFTGNLEARNIPYGDCDVVIADGFTGNVILKLTEGLGLTLSSNIKAVFKRNLISKLAALMVLPGLKDFKKKMDYTEYGGAPLLGISKPVIKAHGSSNAKAFKNAIRQARNFVAGNVINEIIANLPNETGPEESKEN